MTIYIFVNIDSGNDLVPGGIKLFISVRSCGIHLMAISQEMPLDMILKITHLKSYPPLPMVNELIHPGGRVGVFMMLPVALMY